MASPRLSRRPEGLGRSLTLVLLLPIHQATPKVAVAWYWEEGDLFPMNSHIDGRAEEVTAQQEKEDLGFSVGKKVAQDP